MLLFDRRRTKASAILFLVGYCSEGDKYNVFKQEAKQLKQTQCVFQSYSLQAGCVPDLLQYQPVALEEHRAL